MATKISNDAIRASYTVAKNVYEGKLSRAAGITELRQAFSLNPSSAGDMIDNVAHMIRGEQYARTNNAFATDLFLQMIYADYGLDKLKNAISAVTQHLDYYEGLPRGSKLRTIRDIVASFREIAQQATQPKSADGLAPEQRKSFVRQAHRLQAAGEFDPANVKDSRERTIAAIVRRQGQPAFRDKLLNLYDARCAISGCDVPATLEAAHIVPYKGSHTNHPSNGLLLRADLHTLFDLGLLAVDTATMTVLIAQALHGTCYQDYANIPIALPKNQSNGPNSEALDKHRKMSKHFSDQGSSA